MDKKFKIIIAVIAVIIIAIIGAIFILGNSAQTLEGSGATLTIPKDYEINFEKGYATKDDVTIMFSGIMSDPKFTTDLYKALEANGKNSGYENITEDNINGFKAYEYAAKTDNRVMVKYGSSTEWTEYTPLNFTDASGQNIPSDHYRVIDYISPNNSTMNELVIFGKNPDTDLYSNEITEMINSISVKQK